MAVSRPDHWNDLVYTQFRYPGKVKLTFDIMSTISKEDVAVTSSGVLYLTSDKTTIDEDISASEPWATLEGVWRADGASYLPSKVGSENMYMITCSTYQPSNDNPLTLRYDLGSETSFVGLTVIWDNIYQTYPKHVTVDGFSSDGASVFSGSVEVSSVRSILDTPMDGVRIVVLTVTDWVNPDMRARVTEVYFGVSLELTGKNIMSISESTKFDTLNSKLPTDNQTYYLRNQVYKQLAIEGASAVINNTHPLTDISRIFSMDPVLEGIASVEVMYWKADGTLYLPSTNTEENLSMPWMSESPMQDPIELVVTYLDPVQLNQVNITWDSVTNSWPESATIYGFDSFGKEVFQRPFIPSSPDTVITSIYSTVKTIKVLIYKWSRQGWRARIEKFESFLVYGNNNIPSEVNNLFDPTLQLGYSKYLARRQKVRVQYGISDKDNNVYWLPEQLRFLDSWKVPTDSISAEFTSDTRLSFLVDEYRDGVYKSEGSTLYDLALELLQESDIITDVKNPQPWIISERLKTLHTSAPIPVKAINSNLQLIANAAGCILSTNPINGYVQLLDFADTVPIVVNGTVQLQSPGVTVSTPLKKVSVKIYTYSIKDDLTDVYEGSIKLSEQTTLHVDYDSTAGVTECELAVTGATVDYQKLLSYSATITLTPDNPDTEISILIRGKKLSKNSVEVVKYEDPAVDSGVTVDIDNVYITNDELATIVANNAIAQYKKRNTVSTSFLGDPALKGGDRLALYSQYLNNFGTVTSTAFRYNGGFNGTITVLMDELNADKEDTQ